ncbi:right-handed parallel beta-helix repeat-containing protein [Nocardioides sp.]|uniref:right-handed parallel beta-helix repeat-containing protein n=1 Tax=Nocardioides sp. TaxID=35761 RepID=UPI003561AE3D
MSHRGSSLAIRATLVSLFVLLGLIAVPTMASAHVERPSYWPDPKADCTVKPCAGGKVPKARSLRSALDESRRGETRVVCKRDSLKRVKASVQRARKHGYDIRPTDHRTLSAKKARALLQINKRLFKRCGYRYIQEAVTASGNNDRVVVMPGLYRERKSRSQPTYDKSCQKYLTPSDSGDPGALSHDYQIHCPNDANLVAVIGRGPDTGPVPAPRDDRHGIPNVGSCIRCNLQLEGSGVSADDVIIEAGNAAKGNGGPSAAGHKKDVGIFVDRADGFVLRNVNVRHAREHDIYVIETDGYLLDRFKAYYAGGYGVLTFVGDHGVVQNCDVAGHGDSGLYPGSGADSTTDKRYKRFYPKPRFSQVFRKCDSHHNTGGFSGTNSHGTLITKNNFYDNALGYTTDVFTAPGHPGFPQDGNVIADNNFYDNNFNPYQPGSDVDPFIPAPVGTGLWLAGGNANQVVNNRFYDNWRRGVMLFAVPDATVCGPPPVGSSTPVPGCDPAAVSTSFDNRFHGNTMGVSPSGKVQPNGLDFWWDSFPGNTGNCWWDNTAAPGASVTTSPLFLPNCSNGTQPGSSIGVGDVVNEGELVACLAGFEISGYPDGNEDTCSWTTTPTKPSSARTGTDKAMAGGQAAELEAVCANGLSPRLCRAFPSLALLLSLKLPPAVTEPTTTAVKPVASTGTLSSFTCSWWRQADAAQRLGMVQRIRHFATMPIDGPTPYGFGAGMPDARATKLFNSRCSTAYAGSFALYKLYGAAAAFSAVGQ